MKQGVWFIWAAVLAAWFLGSGAISSAGQFAFWGLLVVHAAEFFLKRSVMEAAGGSMGHHFVQTMIYGLFHWKPLEDAAKAGAAGNP